MDKTKILKKTEVTAVLVIVLKWEIQINYNKETQEKIIIH